MIGNYTLRQTPVLQAVLWDGKEETFRAMPGMQQAYGEDYIIDADGTLNCYFDGFFWHQSWQKDRDYIVKGNRGTFFPVPVAHFANLYKPVEVNGDGKVVRTFDVRPRPHIPYDVADFNIHSEAGGRVWFITSERDGVSRWASQKREWGMPETMIQESVPHAIEYWREVCPYWSEDVTVQMVYLGPDDGGFRWIVTEK